MDTLGVSNQMKGRRQATKRKDKGLKVVYISNPMKVKTSASNFRALVQELTGRDSDAAERFMGCDVINADDFVSTYKNVDHVQELRARGEPASVVPSLNSESSSWSTCPDQGSFYEPCNFYDMVPIQTYSQDNSFALPSSFFQESAQLDANYV